MKRCPMCGARERRSVDQNRRYWALLDLIARGVRVPDIETGELKTYSVDTWHVHFRKTHLGCDDFTLPDGQVMTIPRSTTDTDVAEFADYMQAIETWAAERDVYLPDRQEA